MVGITTLIFGLIIIEDLKVGPPGTLESADDVEQESGQHDPPGVSKFVHITLSGSQEMQEVKYYAFGNQNQKGSKQREGVKEGSLFIKLHP